MKLILKNLKQVQHNVEMESEKCTIKQLKEEVEKLYGFDSKVIKLLHNGKVLQDEKTLEEYQIKDESVIIMMNTKPKQKEAPKPAEQPKTEEQPKIEEQPKPASPKKEELKKEEEKPKSEYSDQVNALVDMGYEKEKAEKALNASKGNIDLAIEYLKDGNIPDAEPQNQPNQSQPNTSNKPNVPMELRRNASLIKVLCRDQPEKIFSLLNAIKLKNPSLLNKIKEHEEGFKELLVSPITQKDIDNFRLLEEDIRGMYVGGGQRPGQVQIQLSQEEAEAVKRLQELGGFSQSEVLQAYFACDKNEELAANFLFEQKMNDDMEQDYGNNNDNQDQ